MLMTFCMNGDYAEFHECDEIRRVSSLCATPWSSASTFGPLLPRHPRKGSPVRSRARTSNDETPGSMWPQGRHLVQAAAPMPSGWPHCGHIGRSSCVSHMSSSSHFTIFQSFRPLRKRSSMNTLSGLSSKTTPKDAAAHGSHDFITPMRPAISILCPKRSQLGASKRTLGLLIQASGGALTVWFDADVTTAIVVCIDAGVTAAAQVFLDRDSTFMATCLAALRAVENPAER